jgi:hypothetical protein
MAELVLSPFSNSCQNPKPLYLLHSQDMARNAGSVYNCLLFYEFLSQRLMPMLCSPFTLPYWNGLPSSSSVFVKISFILKYHLLKEGLHDQLIRQFFSMERH